MPNIEIHGAGPVQTIVLHNRIAALLQNSEYCATAKVSLVYDEVYDIKGAPRPFLRLAFVKNELRAVYDDCLGRLAELNLDFQIIVIEKFIPKKE